MLTPHLLFAGLKNILSIETPYEFWFAGTVKECIEIVKEKWTDFSSDSDIKIMATGKIISGVEILALSEVLDSEITVKEVGSNNVIETEVTYGSGAIKSILYNLDGIYYSPKRNN